MAIADEWGLPEELSMTMGHHHDPEGVPKAYKRLTSVLHVADYRCQDGGIGFMDRPFLDEAVFRRSLRELKLESGALDLIFEDMRLEIRKMEDQGLL